jgi:hypothetical protein
MAIARLDLVRRADEAVFRDLDIDTRVRSTIKDDQWQERHAWLPSAGIINDGLDSAAVRRAALETLLGPDRAMEFEVAESGTRARRIRFAGRGGPTASRIDADLYLA